MAADPMPALLDRMHELKDLSGVLGLLSWDQETMMPPGGAEARAHQLAALNAAYHERLVDPRLGGLLEEAGAVSLDEPQRAMVRNLAWAHGRAVRVPVSLVREIAERQSRSVEAWRRARRDDDYASFCPHLERLLELRRAEADALGYQTERYDALLEGFEPGMTASRLAPVFERLSRRLGGRLGETRERPAPGDPFAGKTFDLARQEQLGRRVLEDMGFDFHRGRQDRSTHPFTGGAGDAGDVRLTTRLDPGNPLSGLLSTIHEGGHGLYEQGFDPAHSRTFLAQSPSFGMHESQSRFWENVVGRSRPFWSFYLPVMKALFPEQMRGVELDALLAWLNRVQPGLLRVEADEVTYDLHVMVRFELELAMTRGDLSAADLPEAFREKMRERLGVAPAKDSDGAMQDIHWAWGEIGYFPTYTLGNLYAAMLLERAEAEVPGFWDAVGRGELKVVLGWLRERVHRRGWLWSAEDLVERVTGKRLTEAPFLAYLERRYGAKAG
jgi:carboxypeptidase Taq